MAENHAELNLNGQTYVLDSYIVPFQQPYYVLVRKGGNQALTKSEAESVASAYIQPRGCTAPVKRRGDLDRTNKSSTEWLIGIEC